MKKILLSLAVLLSALLLSVTVCAKADPVFDAANLFDSAEKAKLTEMSLEAGSSSDGDFVIVTVPDTGTKTAREYAVDYYEENGFSQDGAVFLITLCDNEGYRSFWIQTFGAHKAGGTEFDSVSDRITKLLKKSDYSGAAREYLNFVSESGAKAQDTDMASDTLNRIAVCLVIGFAAALIIVLIMKGKMNTVKKASFAGNYVVQGSYNRRALREIFMYSHLTKTRRESSSNSSSHGSGGHGSGGRGGRF